jgi:phosphomannomutase
MIKFGTDGWRAIIGREFTEENVARVAFAHGEVLKEKGLRKVFVGYDWRFGSERFALVASRVLSSMGLDVTLSEEPCTTPMVSFAVRYLGFEGGVMITASHNPPDYNGYKIKESFGGSATSSFLSILEKRIPQKAPEAEDKTEIDTLNIREPYLKAVLNRVELSLFRERELHLVHDAMHGTSAYLLSRALENTKVLTVTMRGWRDPLFGGGPPEPVEKNLGLLAQKVRSLGADLGVANDGDGDRVAFVDERGRFVNSQLVYALLLLHLIRDKGLREGTVVKTVSTTYLADRICRAEGIELKEVPVGFKNINEIVLREKVLFGGEESGGYGFPSFLPERDGLLSALFILEMICAKGKPLSQIIGELFREFGEAHYRRIDVPADDEKKEVLKKVSDSPPSAVAGKKVKKVLTVDGLKLVFEDESWILMRPSGTEPLIRVYGEAPSERELALLLEGAKSLIGV